MDLSPIVEAFSSTVTRRRRGAPTFSAGRARDAAPVDTPIRAVVQPATGEQIARLPEGLRAAASIQVWTEEELRTVSGTLPADQVVVGADVYEVHHLNDRSTDGNYRRAIAVRVS